MVSLFTSKKKIKSICCLDSANNKSKFLKLKNTKLYASKEGIAIVDQKNEWQGRPVSVGEKIMTIANPNNVEFLVWLPVKDSIVIKENAETTIFLDINPMSSYKGKILRSTYEPELSPEEVLSYKLISSFEGNKACLIRSRPLFLYS